MFKCLILAFLAVFFISCGQDEVKIEEVKERPADVPIAKSDANISLPVNCQNGGENCFDELNPPLPVSPK